MSVDGYLYCFDTSGFSNPLEDIPEDIYISLWRQVRKVIGDGKICYNAEISKEMESIYGELGKYLESCKKEICLEIGEERWPWSEYITCAKQLRNDYETVISEYNGDRKGTVGINDISIIALAKTLELPLVSMEKANIYQPSVKKKRIPDICKLVDVRHMDFNGFLREERIIT